MTSWLSSSDAANSGAAPFFPSGVLARREGPRSGRSARATPGSPYSEARLANENARTVKAQRSHQLSDRPQRYGGSGPVAAEAHLDRAQERARQGARDRGTLGHQ